MYFYDILIIREVFYEERYESRRNKKETCGSGN